jgi:hypothetical protein
MNFGALGRSVGDFGSQVGEGYAINQDWKRQASELAIQQARQKLAELMAPLQLKKLQAELDAATRTQPYGTVSTEGGGTAGILYNPQTGTYSTQTLVQGHPVPQFRTVDELTAYALQNNSTELLQQVEDYKQKTQKPTAPRIVTLKDGRSGLMTPDGTVFDPSKRDAQGQMQIIENPEIVQPSMMPSVTSGFTYQVQPDGSIVAVPETHTTQKVPPGKVGASISPNRGVTVGGRPDTALRKQASDLYTLNAQMQVAEQAAANPTPQNSMSLVSIADKLEGGSGQKQNLLANGQPVSIFGIKLGSAGNGTLKPDEAATLLKTVKTFYAAKLKSLADGYAQLGQVPPPWVLPLLQQLNGQGGGAVNTPLPPGATSPGSLVKQ